MGPLSAPCAAHVQYITRFEAIVAFSLLGGTSHSRDKTVTHAMWRGGGQRTAAPILGAGCQSTSAGMPMSDRAAGAAPPAAQAAVVVAAAARAAAERHADVAPSAAVSTAERAGSASAAAAATTAAAGCQAASRGAVTGGASPSVAAGGRDVASAPPPQAPDGHRHRAPRPVVRGAAVVEWSVSRRGTPPPTSKGRHAVAVGGGGDRVGRCRYLPSHRPPRRVLRRAAEGR